VETGQEHSSGRASGRRRPSLTPWNGCATPAADEKHFAYIHRKQSII